MIEFIIYPSARHPQSVSCQDQNRHKMPYLQSKVLVSLCPFVNLDLFKKGFYHVTCALTDTHGEKTGSKISCLEIRDMLGVGVAENCFPGACIIGDQFITHTVQLEYADQSFPLGECFFFEILAPLRQNYTEAYVPAHLKMTLQLKYSNTTEMPPSASMFERLTTRTVSMTVDWRKGLHDHWTVLFDYFHLSAIGVTVHASLCSILPEDLPSLSTPSPSPAPSSSGSNLRSWFFHPPTPPISSQVSYNSLLFGVPSSTSSSSTRRSCYELPSHQIDRAKHVHQMLVDILLTSRDNLRASFSIMSHDEDKETFTVPRTLDLDESLSIEEAEGKCRQHMASLSSCLSVTWEWFCSTAVVHPDLFTYLAQRCHRNRFVWMKMSIVWPDSPYWKHPPDLTSNALVNTVAATARRSLSPSLPLMCVENVEYSTNASVIFLERCPWSCRRPLVQDTIQERYLFQRNISPFILSFLPNARRYRAPPTHLIVCVHGLQGNQFDLRLYRIFLELSLPFQRAIFLMSHANQQDTFVDFNVMTDRLQTELLDYLQDNPLPAKISFIAHSLGGIVVRSLVTRPAIAHLVPRLHLFATICTPHLGTQSQTGVVSAGMWVVRKWYQSTSLLQLSLKDATDVRNSFLYHLSEAPSFEYFSHVVLVTSPQDKYVPQQSAQLLTGDGADAVTEEMCGNLLRGMEEGGVELVRVIVHHSIQTSTDSMIGRAAHIAMLDNERFVEKLVTCHLVQYFMNN